MALNYEASFSTFTETTIIYMYIKLNFHINCISSQKYPRQKYSIFRLFIDLELFMWAYNCTITLYFYLFLGLVETGAIIGPLIGLLLASFCANVYVDTGSVNTGNSIKSICTVSRLYKASQVCYHI